MRERAAGAGASCRFNEIVFAIADDEHRAWRVVDDFFGDTAVKKVRKTGFGMGRHHDKVGVDFPRRLDNFFLNGNSDANEHPDRNMLLYLIAPLRKLPLGVVVHLFVQNVILQNHQFRRWRGGREFGDVQQNNLALEMLCQRDRVGDGFLGTFREIDRRENGLWF